MGTHNMGCSGSKDPQDQFRIKIIDDREMTKFPKVGPDVRDIHIMRTGLKEIPSTLCSEHGETIQTLTLSDNKLEAIPDNIGDMQALTNLTLGGNKGITLPPSIWTLKNV